jgi:hypothetical protein
MMDLLWPALSGVVGLLAVGLGLANWRLGRRLKNLQQQSRQVKSSQVLEDAQLQQLRRSVASGLQQAVDQQVKEFAAGLRQTAAEQQETIKSLSAQITDRQAAAQQQLLEQWQQNLAASASQLQTALKDQSQRLSEQSEAEIAAYKQKMLDRFDHHIDAVVQAFIQDSLGGRVDLGAQMDFLLEQLEAKKAAIKKDLQNG